MRNQLTNVANSRLLQRFIYLTCYNAFYIVSSVDKKGALQQSPNRGMAFKRSGVQFPLAPKFSGIYAKFGKKSPKFNRKSGLFA